MAFDFSKVGVVQNFTTLLGHPFAGSLARESRLLGDLFGLCLLGLPNPGLFQHLAWVVWEEKKVWGTHPTLLKSQGP